MMLPLFLDYKTEAKLCIPMWIPLPITRSNYWFFYFYQIIGLSSAIVHLSSMDLFMNGLLLQITKLLDILAYRFEMINNDADEALVAEHVAFHNYIKR